MLSRIYQFFGLPVVLFVSIPFAAFAAFTTSLAIGVLFVRLSVVYIDLGIALIQSAISPIVPLKRDTPSSSYSSNSYEAAKSRRRRSFGGAATPPHNVVKTSSFASLTGKGTDRDYEGVGGWLLSNDEDEALWMGLNSRLELPAVTTPTSRRHKRNLAGSGQFGSQELSRSPSILRSRTPGTASPEGYFSVQPMSGTREMNPMGISRVSFEPRSTTTSSTESFSSKPRPIGHT